MAQTKRKRRTKHRGNAAGMVEARGRTGRKPTAAELRKDARAAARERQERPPSWRSAINKSALATLIFVGVVVLFLNQDVAQTISMAGFIFLMYIPLGYYTDKFVYDRRMRKKQG